MQIGHQRAEKQYLDVNMPPGSKSNLVATQNYYHFIISPKTANKSSQVVYRLAKIEMYN